MKTNTVIVFFCLALVANASWFESLTKSSWFQQIMNHTKLEGKVNLKTDNGIDFDYNAKLGYNNGKLAFNVADLGAKFNVQAQNTSANLSNGEYNKTYNYNGALVVNHNGHKANVTVDGITGVAGTFDLGNNTNHTLANYTFRTRNQNVWKANGGDLHVDGNHVGLLKVKGNFVGNGSLFRVHNNYRGYSAFGANVTNNDSHVGFGYVVHGGDAELVNNVYATHGNAAEVNYQGHHAIPDAVYHGNGTYNQFSKYGWNNKTGGVKRDGHAGFEGIAWTKSHKDDNSTFSGYATAVNTDFNHKGQVFANGKKVADTLTVGDIAVLKSGGVKVNADGTWEKGFGSTGTLNKWVIGKIGHHQVVSTPEDSSATTSEDSEEFKIACIMNRFSSSQALQEKCKKHKKSDEKGHHHDDHHGHDGEFLGKFKANWASFANITGTPADGNGTNLGFKTGTLYKVGGYDTIHKKPWETHGYKTVSGNYNISAQDGQSNMTISF